MLQALSNVSFAAETDAIDDKPTSFKNLFFRFSIIFDSSAWIHDASSSCIDYWVDVGFAMVQKQQQKNFKWKNVVSNNNNNQS